MTLAPIILFAFNRPWHTQQVLDALARNQEAKDSIIYIYCDGAKKNESNDSLLKIKEVQALIKAENRFKKVIVKIQEKNKGLANSIIDGVTEIIDIHKKVIVLEDDIFVGVFFLKFMNKALEIYENANNVYGVTGYCFPSSKKIPEQTYFLPIMSSWGYGTWADKWNKINFNGQELLDIVQKNKIEDKLDFGNLHYLQMLKDQVEGKNDSWAVRFYVSMLLEKGVFLFPNIALLKNIGFDGTGVHCSQDLEIQKIYFDDKKDIDLTKKNVTLKTEIIKAVKKGPIKTNRGLRIQYKKIIKKIVAPELIQLISRKLNLKEKRNSKRNFLEFPRYTKTTVDLKGHQITIPDGASFHFMKKEIFIEEIYKFKTLNPEPYIIDGGANIGLATIYLKLLYPSSKLIAFEPDANIFNILKSNVESFNFNNIELVKKGLWNENKELFFISEGADAGLIADIDTTGIATETIEVTSLVPYLKNKVDFLKLDIEGSETVVLRDIKDCLDNVDRIFIEYHSFVGQDQSINEIMDILIKADYRLHISSPGLSSKSPFVNVHVYNKMDMQLNIYGFKKDLI
ncbi:FkbM family methyltransferase [Flavobacterium sp. LC2016-12]|uniref:FkbM family methyltransferase n=1 Tax=Flavobacterium sp. LC2016-12 TaxID=2783794 RepID=UPI00188A1454|nr:FkbM family methyltransferase [Flavobacterium sp. LC2016-12]MBF4465658.1 FkbM family methyltransferase [Flavobacterium sp. LC2016-12]